MIGLLFGDGTSHYGKNKAYAVWIDQHQNNSYIIDRAYKEFRKLGLNVHRYKFLNKERAMVYSKQLFQKFRGVKSNPVAYFRGLSDKEKILFISGFFDAEGTITDRIVLYNSNTSLLRAIQKFWLKLGIEGYLYRYGKIHGIQVYRRSQIARLVKNMKSEKVLRSVLPS